MTVPDHHESSMKLLKRAPGTNSSFTAQQKVSAGMMKSSTSSMSWYLHAVHGGPQYDASLGHYYTIWCITGTLLHNMMHHWDTITQYVASLGHYYTMSHCKSAFLCSLQRTSTYPHHYRNPKCSHHEQVSSAWKGWHHHKIEYPQKLVISTAIVHIRHIPRKMGALIPWLGWMVKALLLFKDCKSLVLTVPFQSLFLLQVAYRQ